MPKKYAPPPETPKNGAISISAPIAQLISQSMNLELFLDLAVNGEFDTARRSHKFSISDSTDEELTKRGHMILHPLPAMQGDISWRRHAQQWYFDVASVSFAPDWQWREMTPRGTGDAWLQIHNIQLPEIYVINAEDQLEGQPLAQIIEHPMLIDPEIKIRRFINYPGTKLGDFARAPSVEFQLDVPRITIKR